MNVFLVQHLLEHAAQRTPERPFVIHEQQRATYGEVEAGANRVARALLAQGIQRGDRVAILAQSSRWYVEGYYGAMKAGAIAVPLNTAADAGTLAKQLKSCAPTAVLVGPRFERAATEAVGQAGPIRLLVTAGQPQGLTLPEETTPIDLAEATRAESAEPPHITSIDLDPASIIYTSGSTGTPLGATLSHLSLLTNTRSIVDYLSLTGEDRVLAILPFYYVYGKTLLNTHAAVGGSVVIENRFAFPNTALDTLEKEQCTGLAGVPSTFAILLNRSTFPDRAMPALRYVTQAGGGMSPDLTRRLLGTLKGRRLFVMYGATEASARLSYYCVNDHPEKVGSIGRAISNVELKVVDPEGNEVAVGVTGELAARGANLMTGYWRDPETTQQVMDGLGFYRTGDLAWRDADGFFHLAGRIKDIIKAGAHRISAKEIEDAIQRLPEVHQVAVIGVPDETLGERIKACVVLRDGAATTAEALERALRAHLPAYKMPAVFDLRPSLPMNEAGKVMKQVLRAEQA